MAPRLPNETALGGAPSFRTGRAVVGADSLGAEEKGKALQRLGRSISGAGDTIAAAAERSEKEDQALDLIRADAHYKTSMIRAEREFANDPDYNTYDKRFAETSKKITEESAGLIRDPQLREKFTIQSSVATERHRDKILTRADTIKKQTRFVALGDSLSNYAGIYTDPSTDDATRLRTLQDMRNAITLSERQGLLDPVTAQKFRDTFIEGAQIDEAAVRLQTDPEGLLRDLTGGEQSPDTQENPELRALQKDSDRPLKTTGRPVKRFSGPVNDALNAAATEAGVDPSLLGVFARIESGGRPGVRTGSYKGLFQLSDSEFEKYGGGDIYDPVDNARAGAKKLKADAARFEQKYGRQPTALDLYMIHQQGEGGYAKHMANPDRLAWENMAATGEGRQKGAGWAKRAIWGNIPNDMKKRFGSVDNVTSRQFFEIWNEKIVRFGGTSAQISGIGQPTPRYAELSPKVRTDLIVKANKALEEQRELEADLLRAERILSGELLVDPSNKEDKATIDNAFAASGVTERLSALDPEAAAALTVLAEKTGYVPEAAVSQLRALSVNGNAEQKVYAYETAANLMREKPGIFEGVDKVKRLKNDASLYEAYTVDMGLSAPQAVARIDEMRTPEFEKRREAYKKDADQLVKDVTIADLTSDYGGWFTSSPELGGSLGQSGVVLDAYRDLVKEHFIRTGDPEIAKTMAKKDILKTYNVSTVTGKKRLMRHPPELHYPAIEPTDGGDPDHSYISRQLEQDVKDRAGKDIPIEDIYIEAIPQTSTDVRAGRKDPAYGVIWFVERDGMRIMESAPGMVFRADVKGEMERQTLNRQERIQAEREAEIKRREEIENALPRRAAKAIVKGIKDRMGQPGVTDENFPNLQLAP